MVCSENETLIRKWALYHKRLFGKFNMQLKKTNRQRQFIRNAHSTFMKMKKYGVLICVIAITAIFTCLKEQYKSCELKHYPSFSTRVNPIQGTDLKMVSLSSEDVKNVDSSKQSDVKLETLPNAASGTKWTGQQIRNFPNEKLKFRGKFIKRKKTLDVSRSLRCKSWGVLTTIFRPSEAVRQFLYLNNWCLVVVGDTASPENYRLFTSRSKNMIYLSFEDQKKLQSSFVDSIPSQNYGRKNIGYLYAILNGAEIIWDFDDDNMLKFWLDGAATDPNLWIGTFIPPNQSTVNVSIVQENQDELFFNPYPYLGAPNSKCWPRGFPLSRIHLTSTYYFNRTKVNKEDIAVLQSLADHQPDVDAVYRLTYKTPFEFDRKSSAKSIILLPQTIYSPLNAQASLHFTPGFFALYLPVTVHGRVSDIWRSYVAQTLFSLRGLYVGFMPRPLVHQNRNQHSYEADFQAEIPLYLKTTSLVKFLNGWRNAILTCNDHKKRSTEDLMENLYVELFERGFIEEHDVFCVQLWLQIVAQILAISKEATTQQLLVPFDWTTKHIGKNINSNKKDEMRNEIRLKKKPVTFWTYDLHDGTRVDIPSLLSYLGQTVYIAGNKGSKTPYPHVFQMPGIHIYTNISAQVTAYTHVCTGINNDTIAENVQFYKDNTIFRTVKAMYCSFPSSICELFMPFNQTTSILYIAAHRYNLGRCNKKQWTALNIKLKQLHTMSPDKPKHLIGANNRYDLEYLRYYTGLTRLQLVPSFSGFYTQFTPIKYAPEYDELLFYYQYRFPEIMNHITTFRYIFMRKKYPHFTLQDLANHRAFILFPYSVMSYKTTELYSLNIPMFVPSPTYYKQTGGFGDDRTVTSKYYCCPKQDKNCFETLENFPKYADSYHSYNPNVYYKDHPEDVMYWLQFSDFYEWPHIQYFDNATDLEEKVRSTDYLFIHNRMKEENEIRRHLLLNQWRNIIDAIP